jgi:hypothetical protein
LKAAALTRPAATFFPQAIAVAAGGNHVAVVEQAAEDGAGDNGVAEDLASLTEELTSSHVNLSVPRAWEDAQFGIRAGHGEGARRSGRVAWQADKTGAIACGGAEHCHDAVAERQARASDAGDNLTVGIHLVVGHLRPRDPYTDQEPLKVGPKGGLGDEIAAVEGEGFAHLQGTGGILAGEGGDRRAMGGVDGGEIIRLDQMVERYRALGADNRPRWRRLTSILPLEND